MREKVVKEGVMNERRKVCCSSYLERFAGAIFVHVAFQYEHLRSTREM